MYGVHARDAARRARGRMNKDIRINLDVSKQFTATDYLQARLPGHAPSPARAGLLRPPDHRTPNTSPVAFADQPRDAGSMAALSLRVCSRKAVTPAAACMSRLCLHTMTSLDASMAPTHVACMHSILLVCTAGHDTLCYPHLHACRASVCPP